MKLFNKLFLFLLIAAANTTHAIVIESKDMRDIVDYVTNDTLLFFDIDSTLIDRKKSEGSGKLIKAYWSGSQKKPSVSGVPNFVQKQKPVTPMQKITASLIADFQQEGVMVLGLTARSPSWIDAANEDKTAMQLLCININFRETDYPSSLKQMDSFKRGIIYTRGQLKGPFALECLDSIEWEPKQVVFVDNRKDQCESVDAAMAERGIDCYCFWYRKAELERAAQGQ